MAGYNFVNGQLVKVDNADWTGTSASKAQVYMSDAEFQSRGATIKIEPTPGAPSIASNTPAPVASSAPATFEQAFNTINPSRADPFGFNSGKLAQTAAAPDGAYYSQANKRIAPGQFTKTTEISMADYMSGKYGQDVTLNALSGKAYRHEIVSPDAVMSAYAAKTTPAPVESKPSTVATETPSKVDTGTPEAQVSKPGAVAGAPIKEDPVVQAAGTAEKKIISDTFDRADTIANATTDDNSIYKVRAGYRRKTKLGA